MKIAIVGTGYVGLVTGACFSEIGHEVTCVDKDVGKISALLKGEIPIFEPGLEELVTRNVQDNRLTFTTNLKSAVEEARVIFIAVGTPPMQDGSADLQFVLEVASEIGCYMNSSKVVVDKSTVPVGTSRLVRNTIQDSLEARNLCIEFDIVSNPEFLREGCAIDDFMHPDRIVLGCESSEALEVMKSLYVLLNNGDTEIIAMDTLSAEMTKYAANGMLAAKVSYINEVAQICERVGADVEQVRRGIGSDHRIGFEFISPGIGYGGSCFPKDVSALIKISNDVGYAPELLQAVESVNRRQKQHLFEKAVARFGKDLRGRHFAVWGLAFKPNTDDVREAPSLTLIESLLGAGASVSAYDPEASDEALAYLGDHDELSFTEDHYAALRNVDAVFIVTEWSLFHRPDFARMKSVMKSPIIFDGRNLYSPSQIDSQGFEYTSVGRCKKPNLMLVDVSPDAWIPPSLSQVIA